MFRDIATVRSGLAEQKYIATESIATTLFLASRLEKPILAEGPAGTGKTELAKATAAATGRELIRLQCYEGIDEARALYEWEYAKQLLYTQLLRERIGDMVSAATSLAAAAVALASSVLPVPAGPSARIGFSSRLARNNVVAIDSDAMYFWSARRVRTVAISRNICYLHVCRG